MEAQIRTAMGPFQEDLWIERRLRLDEISQILDRMEAKSPEDKETISDWQRFFGFLAEYCSGADYANDKQWNELMTLMSISRRLNHRSVRLKDLLKNKQLIEANQKSIRQLRQSARLGQTIDRSLKELETNLQACRLQLSADGMEEDDGQSLLKPLGDCIKYMQNNCWPLLRTLRLELSGPSSWSSSWSENNQWLAISSQQLEQWSTSLRFFEIALANLSHFLDRMHLFESHLSHLRPLVSSVAERGAEEADEHKNRASLSDTGQQLDDSLNQCKRYFEQVHEFRYRLVQALKNQAKRSKSPSNKNSIGLALMRLVHPKSGQFVVDGGEMYERELQIGVEKGQECRRILDKIMRSLRLEFGRFYFVNDLELLTIISLDSRLISQCRLDSHRQLISKLFNNAISSFEVQSAGPTASITGVRSPFGELVLLEGESPVPLKKPVNVYSVEIVRILNEVMRKLRRSLRRLLREYLSNVASLESIYASAWTRSELPIQLANLAEQVKFTQLLEDSLAVRSLNKGLDEVLAFYESRFEQLSQSDALAAGDRQLRRSAALSMSVQFISAILRLKMQQVASVDDWNWQKLARYYLVDINNNNNNNNNNSDHWQVEVRIANARFHYKFDYLTIQVDTNQTQAQFKRLISTQTSERCWLVASQAVGRLKLGTCPFGPAGSGKTETVKALGHALGCQVVVHNCDESNEAQQLERLVWGLAHTGLWGCFDEFNRLASSTLSSVSATLELIQTSLLRAAATAAAAAPNDQTTCCIVELDDGEPISIDMDSAFFITLNPGDQLKYRGRRQLPANLRSLFLPVSMQQVEVAPIVSESLLAFGAGLDSDKCESTNINIKLNAQEATRMGQLLAGWLDWMRGHGQRRSNRCEWDLRLVMAILRRLKVLPTTSSDCKDLLLARAIKCELEARLDGLERQILLQSLGELLPADVSGKLLQEEKEANHDHEDEDESMRALEEQLKTRPGVILVGASQSGKSRCWRRLQQRLGPAVEWLAFNPKSCSKDRLFGYLKSESTAAAAAAAAAAGQQSRRWVDGHFTRLVRRALDLLARRAELAQVWLVLDGRIDPDWIESLNSALDDNQVLTLSSGERLNMFVHQGPATCKSIKLLFETTSIEFASPATISRLGLVYFEQCAHEDEYNAWKDDDDDGKLVESFFGDQSDNRLLLVSGNAKWPSVNNCIEYNCSEGSQSSHLLELLDLKQEEGLRSTTLVIRNLNLIEAEDNWQSKSFVELVRYILTYDCYYDDNFNLIQANRIKFVICLDEQQQQQQQQQLLNDSRLASLAKHRIRVNTREGLQQIQQVATREALVDLICGQDSPRVISLKVSGLASGQHLLNELLQPADNKTADIAKDQQPPAVVGFNNSNQIRRGLELLARSSETSSCKLLVFALSELELSLMGRRRRSRLLHLLNLLRLRPDRASRFVYLGRFCGHEARLERTFWQWMGPIYELHGPGVGVGRQRNGLRQVASDAVSEWDSQLSQSSIDWLVHKIDLITSKTSSNRKEHFVQVFGRICSEAREKLGQVRRALSNGLDCLGRFELSVDRIRQQRRADEGQLEASKAAISRLMGELDEKLGRAKGQRRRLEELRRRQAEKSQQAHEKSESIEAQLRRVLPEVEKSQLEVNRCLNPEALNEIKTLRAPPKAIKDILDVLFVLLGRPDSSWASIKSYLIKSSLRDELANYDLLGRLNADLIRRAEAEMASRARSDSFKPEVAQRASSAIVPVLSWIQAVLGYGRVLVRVKPMQDELEKLREDARQVGELMASSERELQQIDELIEVETSRLDESRGELARAETRALKNKAGLDEAEAIRQRVAGQANRWRERLHSMEWFFATDRGQSEALSYCLLATCLALLYQNNKSDDDDDDDDDGLDVYTSLLEDIQQSGIDETLVMSRVVSLFNAEVADRLDLSLIRTRDEKRHVWQLIALHILTSIDCKCTALLNLDGQQDDDVSGEDLAAYLGFKNSLLLQERQQQSKGKPGKDCVLIKVNEQPSNNTSSRLLEMHLKQAKNNNNNKLILVQLVSSPETSSSSSSSSSSPPATHNDSNDDDDDDESLDIIDLILNARAQSGQAGRLVLLGRFEQLNRQLQALVRPINIQLAASVQLTATAGKQEEKVTNTLIDLFVALNDPELNGRAGQIEQEIRLKQAQLKALEANLLRRLTLSMQTGAGASSGPGLQHYDNLEQHYDLIRVLNESYQSNWTLEVSLREMQAKLADLAQARASFDGFARAGGRFYLNCLLDYYNKHQLNGLHRVPLPRFAELMYRLRYESDNDREDDKAAASLLAYLMRPMRPDDRQRFAASLATSSELMEIFKVKDVQLADILQVAGRRAANLRLLIEEELRLGSPSCSWSWPGRLVCLVHDSRGSSPQVELDELMRQLTRSDGNKYSLSYHKLYATTTTTTTTTTTSTTTTTTTAPSKRAAVANEDDVDGNVDETSQLESSTSLLEWKLIKILANYRQQAKATTTTTTTRVVCIANAHLASSWLNSRLLPLLGKSLTRNNKSDANNSSQGNSNINKFLIILVAEQSTLGNQTGSGASRPSSDSQPVFAGSLLDGAHAKCWHDQLALQLVDRFHLSMGLVHSTKLSGQLKSHRFFVSKQESAELLIKGLVLLHVVCQELTRLREQDEQEEEEAASIAGWQSSGYTFDYNQLDLGLKVLQQILDVVGQPGRSLEQVRCLWCHQLEDFVYGPRMESPADEQRLSHLIGRLLGSMQLVSAKLERLLASSNEGQHSPAAAAAASCRLLADLID